MTIVELNAYKMELLSEIVNGFTTENALRKLKAACRFIKDGELADGLRTMPSSLLDELMTASLEQDKAGLSVSHDELKAEMAQW